MSKESFNLNSELSKHGIENEDDWREDFPVFSYAYGEEAELNKIKLAENLEKVINEENTVKRLDFILGLPCSEAVELIKSEYFPSSSRNFLAVRLEKYRDLAESVRHKKNDDDRYEFYDEAYSTRLGLRRDILYAAMIGTPEMGAVRIATNRINQELIKKNVQPLRSVVTLFGYYSGIRNDSIGQYRELAELYEKCKEDVEKKYAESDLTEKQREHKAVLQMARILEGVYGYGGVMNDSASPYNAGFKESIVASQLGYRVMRQLRGMRNKISSSDFRNISRFIGKSGDNKHEEEKKELDVKINVLREYLELRQDSDNRISEKTVNDFIDEENNKEISKQERWYEKERGKIEHRLEKEKGEIEALDLPEEEKELQLESVNTKYDKSLSVMMEDYQRQVDYFRNRTTEQLLNNLAERQNVVKERYEKRKSLAQMAIDLHFRFNGKDSPDVLKTLLIG